VVPAKWVAFAVNRQKTLTMYGQPSGSAPSGANQFDPSGKYKIKNSGKSSPNTTHLSPANNTLGWLAPQRVVGM
jgi:hypothetical protein